MLLSSHHPANQLSCIPLYHPPILNYPAYVYPIIHAKLPKLHHLPAPKRSATHASLYGCPACHGLSEPVFFVAVGPFLPRLSRRNMIPCALHRGVTIHTAREMPVLSSEFMPRDLGLRVVHLQPSHWQCLALRNTGKIDAVPELLRTLRDGWNASNEYKAVRIALFLSSSTSQLFSSRPSFFPPQYSSFSFKLDRVYRFVNNGQHQVFRRHCAFPPCRH